MKVEHGKCFPMGSGLAGFFLCNARFVLTLSKYSFRINAVIYTK